MPNRAKVASVDCGCFWLNGGSGDFTIRLFDGLGVAANLTGEHASNIGTGIDLDKVMFSMGPRYTYNLRLQWGDAGLLSSAKVCLAALWLQHDLSFFHRNSRCGKYLRNAAWWRSGPSLCQKMLIWRNAIRVTWAVPSRRSSWDGRVSPMCLGAGRTFTSARVIGVSLSETSGTDAIIAHELDHLNGLRDYVFFLKA